MQEAAIVPEHRGEFSPPNVQFFRPGALRIRGTAFGILLLAVFCFYIAARLTPSPSGYGTHRQLGYPACLMPILTGHPCPTCGMTTAFTHAVRGQFLSAFHAQPAGLALALGLFAGCMCCIRIVVTGNYDFIKFRVQPGRLALLVLAFVLFAWIYKFMTFSP